MRRHRAILGIGLLLLAALLAAAALGAVKPSLGLRAAATAKVGRVLDLTGTVRNAKTSSTSVLICEKVGAQWQRIATAKLSARHTFAAKVTPQSLGTWRLIALYEYKAGTTRAQARSNVVAITVGPLAMTLMLCQGATGAQEAAFAGAIGKVTGWTIAADGALTLTGTVDMVSKPAGGG